MYRNKENTASIYSLISELPKSDLKPIYFFFGEDHFTINNAIKVIEQKASQFISSDFDKEIIDIEKKDSITNLVDLALTFPFGSGKKLLIVKNFENFANKKQINSYIINPAESTILVIANYGAISNLNSEPYKILSEKNYLFEAKELKGADLENWVKRRCSQLEIEVTSENIKMLIEIIGEDKSLLEMQFQKLKSFLNDKKEITAEEIKSLSSATKEYTIFDLLNSIGKGNKSNSLKVLFNLLETGKDLIFVISMLTKYFMVISQSFELKQRGLNDAEASQAIGVSKYYYINCKNASYFNNEKKVQKAFIALFNADFTLKTSGIEEKTLATILLTEIFEE
ncbi:MAG: DNA polymerase III subunit delta [Ignavibacteriae bacterium]|nr:DNA polymerase III subunit delta [Ignavibacteriota bacterium]